MLLRMGLQGCAQPAAEASPWELIRKARGQKAGSFLSLISQTGAFLVLSDHHMPSLVTGKEAAPLSASPTHKLFIHIKW